MIDNADFDTETPTVKGRDPAWRQLAIHEAAHVIAHYTFGRILFHVALCSENGGWVQPPLGEESTVYKIRQNMVISACGSIAEKNICEDCNTKPSGKDLDDLRVGATRIHGMVASKQVVDDEIKNAICRATVLVQRYRFAIEIIANSLLSVVDEIESLSPDIFGKENPLP